MGIDASIPMSGKAPDPTQQLSSLLNVANSAQTYKNNGISLNERQALQPFLSNPSNYTDDQGNIDFNKAMPNIMRLAPTTGQKYLTDLAGAQKAHTDAQSAINSLTTENRGQISRVLASLPPGASPDVVGKTVEALNEQYKGIKPATNVFLQGYKNALTKGPGAADDFIQQQARGVLPQETQQGLNTPAGVTINNGQQSAVVNLKPGVQGIPQGGIVQGTQVQNLLPPGAQESVGSDAFGTQFVTQRDSKGNVVGTRPLQSAAPGVQGPASFPPGESQETFKALNEERLGAQAAARNAATMHDLNRTVAAEASKGFNTGSLGALTQKIASATGYKMGTGESATDYNVLGKMLERSALTAAQSMGPHTNAGLEASIRANGSLEYTPQALKKIAYLNDALVTGSELYSKGLEKAIASSPNNVFAKREFDREWGKAATPQALRLKNAVDNGNKEEVENIVKEVGGKGTKAAQALHGQLKRLHDLAGQ